MSGETDLEWVMIHFLTRSHMLSKIRSNLSLRHVSIRGLGSAGLTTHTFMPSSVSISPFASRQRCT